MLTDDDKLQKAFRLIHALYEDDRGVPLCVLQDAYEQLPLVRKLQQRRPDAAHPFKLRIPEEGFLQVAVYRASEIWERDQESARPRKEPAYRPTREDMLARYVKTLVLKSMDRNSRYAAVGLGCLLYTYEPHEVGGLAEEFFDTDNIRRVKGWMSARVGERFPGACVRDADGGGQVALRPPSDRERAVIGMSLSNFAPWCSCRDEAAPPPPAPLLETYFEEGCGRTEWERIHVLFDTRCGGLPRLVREFNSIYGKGNEMRLEDPDEKLGSPSFGDDFRGPAGSGDGGPPDPGDRFNPAPLDRHELSSIKHSFERNQRRRRDYHAGGQLRVYVDGEEAAAFTHGLTFEPLAIPDTASHVEVFGEDEEGDLLLAVFPLAYAEDGHDDADLKLSITHDGGQTVALTLARAPGEDGERGGAVLRLEYSEPAAAEPSKPVYAGVNAVWAIEALDAAVDVTLNTTLSERYQIIKRLGEGGMGVVYVANDKALGRRVAVKVLPSLFDEERAAIKAAIKKEIEALACVSHPGVVPMLDYGELPGGEPYFVREYVSGPSLRSEIGPGGMDSARAAALARQMAQTLAAAHAHDIFHRDIKPENVIVHRDGDKEYVKVVDFGTSSTAPAHFDHGPPPSEFRLDRAAFARARDWLAQPEAGAARRAGHFDYMSPEQLLGEGAAAADVWSLGATVYEMLTGRPPFSAASPRQLLELQRAGAFVNPCELRPELPPATREVFARALAFEPRDRYFNIWDFGDAIARALAPRRREPPSVFISYG